jgi:hypothetical protein
MVGSRDGQSVGVPVGSRVGPSVGNCGRNKRAVRGGERRLLG